MNCSHRKMGRKGMVGVKRTTASMNPSYDMGESLYLWKVHNVTLGAFLCWETQGKGVPLSALPKRTES